MTIFLSIALVLLAAAPVAAQSAADAEIGQRIIAMERAALDRWGKGDVNGYFEIMANDITYFDPNVDRRVDGLAAIRAYIGPFAGKIRIDRYEMVEPKVQVAGDVAVLSFRIVNYATQPDGRETVANRWNTTEIYRRIQGEWKIAHSHFSFTRPPLAGRASQ